MTEVWNEEKETKALRKRKSEALEEHFKRLDERRRSDDLKIYGKTNQGNIPGSPAEPTKHLAGLVIPTYDSSRRFEPTSEIIFFEGMRSVRVLGRIQSQTKSTVTYESEFGIVHQIPRESIRGYREFSQIETENRIARRRRRPGSVIQRGY